MDYQKIYNNLIIKRQKSILRDCYFEKHHIIPKCLGGSNKKENIVKLTPEEHFLAHQLLVKIYPDHKGLKYALYMMTKAPNGRRQSNKLYGWIKRDYIKNRPQSRGSTGKILSPEHKKRLLEANLGSKKSEETKRKISNTKKGVKMTPEALTSIREKRKNHPTWLNSQRNKKISDEAKAKISAANNGRVLPTKSCPHCGKNGAGPNMTRYHFNNCKLK